MVRSGCRRRCDMTAAALLAAACAAFIHATHQVQPTAAQGSVPVVDNGFFTQVADFNAPVDMSGQANQAADTSGGALLRGCVHDVSTDTSPLMPHVARWAAGLMLAHQLLLKTVAAMVPGGPKAVLNMGA